MTMMDLAHHIIAVAHENNIPVTNLQLQKVMFFSLKHAMNANLLPQEVIEEMYDRPFLVWRYGPVVEDVYNEFSVYGATPILDDYTLVKELDNEGFNREICDLLKQNVFKLVRESHQESFWKENESQIVFGRGNARYQLDDVRKQ
nr:type II toxin-antitoxin system antitoxin SocA domain-containing protein [Limosilactobacillus mucosae]